MIFHSPWWTNVSSVIIIINPLLSQYHWGRLNFFKSGFGGWHVHSCYKHDRGEWHFIPRFTHSFTLQIFMRHLLCAGWKKTNNEWADSKDGSLCIKDWMPCLGHGREHMPPAGERFHRCYNPAGSLFPLWSWGRLLGWKDPRSLHWGAMCEE